MTVKLGAGTMKVTIKVENGESAADAKKIKKLLRELNVAPWLNVHIHYASEYGEIGHPPYGSDLDV